MSTTHPSERSGALSSKHEPREKSGSGKPFGHDAGLTGAALEDGLALVGPEDARRRVVESLMSDAMASGEGFCVVSLDRSAALCDAAHAMAAAHDRTDRLRTVEAGLPVERTHVLDPFADLDAEGLVRIVLSSSPSLAGAGPDAGRARALLSAMAGAVVGMRDAGQVDVTPTLLRSNIELGTFRSLDDKGSYPMIGDGVRTEIRRYLHGLPDLWGQQGRSASRVSDHHSAAHDHVLDAISWMHEPDQVPLIASGAADVTVSDLASGMSVVLHAAVGVGRDRAPGFLVACLGEALRMRQGDDPLLVVVDGIQNLSPANADILRGFLGRGVRLVLGCSGTPGPDHARLLREMPWKAILPGSGHGTAPSLGLPDTLDRDAAYGLSVLAHGDSFLQVDVPANRRASVHGNVDRFTRSTTLEEVESTEVPTEVMSRLMHPRLPEVAEKFAAGLSLTAVAGAVGMAFSGQPDDGHGFRRPACMAVAMASLVGTDP